MTLTIMRAERSPQLTADVASAPAAVLLLHGYGSNERDLTSLAPALGLTLPWVSLRAPIDVSSTGAAWFTITAPGNPDPEPVLEATEAIWSWVDEHIHRDTKIVPIGFSQGGLMASQLLRTRPERVLAPVILSGFVLGGPQAADERLTETRPALLWARGSADRVITAAAVERTRTFLPGHSTLVERVHPGLAHGISADVLDDVRDFLVAQVGPEALSDR